MKTRSIIIIMCLAVAGCDAADEGRSVCQLASDHVAHCLGHPTAQGPGAACDAKNAALANDLLGLSCPGVRSLKANALGKADGAWCLAPWDCPDQFPAKDEACGFSDMVKCQNHCEEMYASAHMRLTKVTCQLLEQDVAHCQCKGYWLPWPEGSDDDPDDPKDPDPDPDGWDW